MKKSMVVLLIAVLMMPLLVLGGTTVDNLGQKVKESKGMVEYVKEQEASISEYAQLIEDLSANLTELNTQVQVLEAELASYDIQSYDEAFSMARFPDSCDIESGLFSYHDIIQMLVANGNPLELAKTKALCICSQTDVFYKFAVIEDMTATTAPVPACINFNILMSIIGNPIAEKCELLVE